MINIRSASVRAKPRSTGPRAPPDNIVRDSYHFNSLKRDTAFAVSLFNETSGIRSFTNFPNPLKERSSAILFLDLLITYSKPKTNAYQFEIGIDSLLFIKHNCSAQASACQQQGRQPSLVGVDNMVNCTCQKAASC